MVSHSNIAPTETDDYIALCTCHGIPAYPEMDHKMPFWVCEIDDVSCEVEFGEVLRGVK